MRIPGRICAALCLFANCALHAESGYNVWLRYAPLNATAGRQYLDTLPAVLAVSGDSAVMTSVREELLRGIRGMTNRMERLASGLPEESAIVVGTTASLAALHLPAANLPPESYWLKTVLQGKNRYLVVAGADERGVLYGAFALLRKIAMGETAGALDEKQAPYAPIRWVNQWDNLDGSIERGYGGRSIFWDAGKARADLHRVSDYGRMLASLGINGATIDNVNADKRLLSPEFIPQVARIAEAFRPWGVRVAISVDFGSPQSLGGLDSFDPLDPRVAAWWQARADEVYAAVPDLAGFVLKADSEGRVGPSAYKRSHADAANVVARALKPHGGVLLYRGFVYDHHMDWNNPKNDRARAAYDNFKPLDGQFDGNVVIQIKNGPIDFQVREPVSPLFGGLEKTNEALELQVTQEYMGQAKQLVYLAPQWKEVLDFDLHAKPGGATPVKALAAGKTFGRPTGGFVGVVNVGLDENWMGNQLSQANLYAFGRLAWNPDLKANQIAEEWTRLTFGNDPEVVRTIDDLQMKSWPAYEEYTGPLGLQTLTDIVGDHYGVAVEASERNGWGQWHRADRQGVGMDRTAEGTGYIGQYSPAVASMYRSLASCPDDLLLFMHHVPYTYKLHNGKTVIQYIYDSHYEGAATAGGYAREWKQLKGRVDDQRFAEVLDQLEYQAGQAIVWRDAVSNWFLRASGIPDAKGRVGNYPNRVEAEAMHLVGYTATDVTPWEAASGGKAVTCPAAECVASWRYDGPAGWFTLAVQYFDQPAGVAHFQMRVGSQIVDDWAAAARNPARRINASSSTRRRIEGIALRPGDIISIEGKPAERDPAAIDYVEILPQ